MMIHIVIPVRNNLEVTLECLRLLSLQTWRDFDVTVTDDGSTDGTYEAIREQFPSVTVLRGDGNLWWTGAINTALEYILPKTADDDYILTLNDDVVFDENYLANLAEAARMRPGWLIGSVSFDKDDPERVVDAGIYFNERNRNILRGNYKPGFNFNDKVNCLSGRGALIPVIVFRSIGLYNDRHLHHYAADNELSLRANRNGFPSCVFFGAILYSDTSKSGFKFTPFMKLSLKQAWNLIFSRKSSMQTKARLYWAWLSLPKKYFVVHFFAEMFNVLQVLTSIPPLWYGKILFAPVVKWAKNKMI